MTASWLDVWERKGSEETSDLKVLNGYESTSIDPREVAARITRALEITPETRVLEIGCGAGMLAKHLECDYVGIDYARAMVTRHIGLLGNTVARGEARELMFRDGWFDVVFAFSVFQYFPDVGYAREAVAEMTRVARRAVLIGDLPLRSHRAEHLIFRQDQFPGWDLEPGYYNPDRFNCLARRGDAGWPPAAVI